MQKALLLSVVAGVAAVPVMSRDLPAADMAAMSVLLLLVALLGVLASRIGTPG